jgi:hypothetical protein
MIGRIRVKIGAKYTQYDLMRTLGQTVVLSMTGNLNFPAPAPTLASIQSAVTALSNAITAWGTVGNRGTHQDLVNLRNASLALLKLLQQEAAYVQNLVDPNADELTQSAFILSSGFSIRQLPSPQGVLNPPQDLRQFFKPNINIRFVALRWKKPLALLSPNNVKSYTVLRGITADFTAAVEIGIVKKVTIIDTTAVAGTSYWYWVVANNTAGPGAESVPVEITTPLA